MNIAGPRTATVIFDTLARTTLFNVVATEVAKSFKKWELALIIAPILTLENITFPMSSVIPLRISVVSVVVCVVVGVVLVVGVVDVSVLVNVVDEVLVKVDVEVVVIVDVSV